MQVQTSFAAPAKNILIFYALNVPAVPHEYDKILKELFAQVKATMLKLLFNIEAVQIISLGGKLQQTILEKEADTVAEITTTHGEQFIMHIEWQTTNDRKMADRMLLYNNLLRLKYNKPVRGVVVYLGSDKLRMEASIKTYGLNYRYKLVDIRQLKPSGFLQASEAAGWILAVLAGKGADKRKIIREILHKLHYGLKKQPEDFKIKIKQLEILSLLRGTEAQNQVLKEEQNMPVTIDITKDQRFQEGVSKGLQKGIEKGKKLGMAEGIAEGKLETAVRLIENGVPISIIHKATGIDMKKLLELSKNVKH
ncbi:hypothetical protein [Foetidibacter luteolus]|uniref:hypothetical protein n=1 Tax=Foetidibacter luteolus TaxID=2608880 RepID=UPI00129A19A1|nr:hypothetical protein [Foetidibacter luteolus]